MPSDSDLQGSVEKMRHAFRASSEGHEILPSRDRHDDVRSGRAGHEGDVTGDRSPLAALHPFFRGLLETLPDPGADWPRAQREQWLETARNIFALIYKDPGEERKPVRLMEAQQPAPPTQLDQRTA